MCSSLKLLNCILSLNMWREHDEFELSCNA